MTGGRLSNMSSDKQGFPDDRDRELQRQAERTWEMADELVEWLGKHSAARRNGDHAIDPDEEFTLMRLRRRASNLCHSSEVPVAGAVYGASQTGKSLFVGRVLEPSDRRDSPLGKCDQLDPDAYIRELSFSVDINPQCGSNEATALVTRFTTKDRFDRDALPEYPVKIRALSRAEWLRVLARGFLSECRKPNFVWDEGQLGALFEETYAAYRADEVDRNWRMDLLDVYTYMRGLEHLVYRAEEPLFNSFLSQYPLTEAGYVEIAGRLFWDREHFPTLTSLFNEVHAFLKKITSGGRDGILVHWAAVRFLLDSQRSTEHQSDRSRWRRSVKWTDLKDDVKDGWYVLDYRPGAGPPKDDLSIIQSAMLEMILPVIPHRMNEDWRDVIQKMDILDLPGMLAGGGDSAEGGATRIESLDAKMMVVKRGKVFYLIDRYIEERQVQTFLLLVRGGNLNVRQLLKEYIDKWGKARYGEDVWPQRVATPHPALFIGMTGIDAEFKDREMNRNLYDARLKTIVDYTLREVMTDFGGPGQPFTNVFPVRYPGTWDCDEQKRLALGPAKWDEAGKVFVQSEMVRRYVHNPEEKWKVAMRDADGGLSLISRGFLQCTTALQKQDALQQDIRSVHQSLRSLAESWYCNPDVNQDREKRIGTARRVLQWLADEERVYDRVHALKSSLDFREGTTMELSEFAEMRSTRDRSRPEAIEQRFPQYLKTFLYNWAREGATERWRKYTETNRGGAPWLTTEDFGNFTRYLCDYLCCESVFSILTSRLLSVITLAVRDERARRHARREYVRLILNDFVMNPGPSSEPLEEMDEDDGGDFGLMDSFIARWRRRLPLALASAAGEHVVIPSGNDELQRLLANY